jgi:hypothetical protein
MASHCDVYNVKQEHKNNWCFKNNLQIFLQTSVGAAGSPKGHTS